MTKDECVALIKAIGKEGEWSVVEFPQGSGMYVFVAALSEVE